MKSDLKKLKQKQQQPQHQTENNVQPKPPVCKNALMRMFLIAITVKNVVEITTLLVIVVSRQTGGGCRGGQIVTPEAKGQKLSHECNHCLQEENGKKFKKVFSIPHCFIAANVAKRNSGVNTKSCVMPLVT